MSYSIGIFHPLDDLSQARYQDYQLRSILLPLNLALLSLNPLARINRYVVKTLDNAESVKLQYRSLAKVSDDSSSKALPSKVALNWL